MLSYQREQGSPPRYRLNEPNRYAMLKPAPPPRPLAAKVPPSWGLQIHVYEVIKHYNTIYFRRKTHGAAAQ